MAFRFIESHFPGLIVRQQEPPVRRSLWRGSGLAFAGTHFERAAQLAIVIGSLLAAAVGIAILLTSKATQAPDPN